jgi:hypothetical protein
MTTPPTPAGWYPDPDGSGGQRYWDGIIWTEHRFPAAPAAPPPAPVESPAPAEPAPSAQPAASDEATTIVQLRPIPTATPSGGAHRKPDPEPEPEPEPVAEPEIVSQPEPEPEPVTESEPPIYTGTTEPVTQVFTRSFPSFTPDTPPSAHDAPPSTPPFGFPSSPRPADPPQADFSSSDYSSADYSSAGFSSSGFSSAPPSSGPFPSAPLYDTTAPETKPPSGNRSLVTLYLAACAALLAVLVGLAIYGFIIKKDPSVQIASPGTDTTTEASESSEAPSETDGPGSSATPTNPPTAPAATGDAIDGPLSFTVHGIEVGSTVVMSDAPLEKTAVGEYIVVHMTVTNVGADPTSFVATFQTLHAGGAPYPLDDEATAYLEGTLAGLEPGDSADVSIAFDVPPGTPAEAIELHADPGTPGAQVPLS